jgi:hypothetical protein
MARQPGEGVIQTVFRRREGISTVLMGVAAVMTTWCAFQNAMWNGEQTLQFTASAASRVESARAELAGNQALQVDVATFLAWAQAVRAEVGPRGLREGREYEIDPRTLSGFLFERFRPDFRPAVRAWLSRRPLLSSEAPSTPFAMEEYTRPLEDSAQQLLAVAEEKAMLGRRAKQVADAYVLTTVITAFVVFFGGLSAKLTRPNNAFWLLTLASASFMACGIRLLWLPVKLLHG